MTRRQCPNCASFHLWEPPAPDPRGVPIIDAADDPLDDAELCETIVRGAVQWLFHGMFAALPTRTARDGNGKFQVLSEGELVPGFTMAMVEARAERATQVMQFVCKEKAWCPACTSFAIECATERYLCASENDTRFYTECGLYGTA